MTTELQRARAHLLDCQKRLADVRKGPNYESDMPKNWRKSQWHAGLVSFSEANVLAALSRVWDAQKRQADRPIRELRADMLAGHMTVNDARRIVCLPPIHDPVVDHVLKREIGRWHLLE